MIDVTFRPATAADCEFAYQTKKAAFGEYIAMAWGWDDAEQRRLHEKRFAEEEFQIIQISGADAGIVSVARRPDHVKIDQLFILPEYQGKGIGTECVKRVLEEANRQGLPVRLRVMKVNPRALAFYQRLGFREIGETETHFLMERSS